MTTLLRYVLALFSLAICCQVSIRPVPFQLPVTKLTYEGFINILELYPSCKLFLTIFRPECTEPKSLNSLISTVLVSMTFSVDLKKHKFYT